MVKLREFYCKRLKWIVAFICFVSAMGVARGAPLSRAAMAEQALMVRAAKLIELKHYPRALGILKRVLKHNPKNRAAAFNVALVLMQLERYPLALEWWNRIATPENPLLVPVKIYRARTLRFSGSPDAALLALRELNGLPLPAGIQQLLRTELEQTEDVIFQKGQHFYDGKFYTEAIAEFNKVKDSSLSDDALVMQSLCWLELGELGKAKETINLATAEARDDEIKEMIAKVKVRIAREIRADTDWSFFASVKSGVEGNIYDDGLEVQRSSALKSVVLAQYDGNLTDKLDFSSEFAFRDEVYFKDSGIRSTKIENNTGIRVRESPWLVSIGPQLGYEWAAFVPNLVQGGIQLMFEMPGDKVDYSQLLTISTQRGAKEEFRYLDGKSIDFNFGAELKNFRTNPRLDFMWRDVFLGQMLLSDGSQLPQGYWELGLGLSFGGRLTRAMRSALYFSAAYRSYYDLVLPENVKRQDVNLKSRSRFVYSTGILGLQLSLDFEVERNRSTLNGVATYFDKDYWDYRVLLGLEKRWGE